MKDTTDMLNIIDMINDSSIFTEDSILVSFDIVNMLSSINNVSGLEAVSEILENRETNSPPAECILEVLKFCLECNNSLFNEKFYLQEDGTAMGPHMSCYYSDIAMYRFDLKALSYTPKVFCCKRFRDDIFKVWNHSLQELYKFFEFMNSIDTSGNIKFTSVAIDNSILEFLDLCLHINEDNKICVDVYTKPANNFTYVLPSTCYPKKSINKVPKEIALRLRRIYHSDEKNNKEQYVGSAFKDKFKPRFRVHKTDVLTGKDRCGVAKHFLTNVKMVAKLKTLKLNSFNKCKREIMILKVSCGIEKSIGKPNSLLCLME